ncbi:hypothetical protein [Endozoicomonas sp. ONNA1]|uniref:hypothetical protein n=1 Tax=Endozoicomonas sp. ONNA1 TaxID=2828740 RepID=UPI00214989EE|nr:hypothetical protein [Endozoicomonas sp. ONNA1]
MLIILETRQIVQEFSNNICCLSNVFFTNLETFIREVIDVQSQVNNNYDVLEQTMLRFYPQVRLSTLDVRLANSAVQCFLDNIDSVIVYKNLPTESFRVLKLVGHDLLIEYKESIHYEN